MIPLNAALALGAITLLRLIWLAVGDTDLYPDEAQYWLWSTDPAFGYFSKPPLLAWLIAATTAMFGDSEMAVRLSAPFLHAAAAVLIGAAAGRLGYGRRTAGWAAVAYLTLPGVSVSSAIISTDAPLLACWAGALYAFLRARESQKAGWWALVGLAVGVGLLAKYAMVFWLLSAAFLVARERMPWRGPGLALLVSGLAYAPNLAWNAANGFVSYAHTQANANLSADIVHPDRFAEFFGSQFLVFGPVFFAVLLVLLARWRSLEPRERLLLSFVAPVLGVIMVQSMLSRAHPNWAATAYVAGTILVAGRLARPGAGAWLAGSVIVHAVVAGLLLGARPAALAVGADLPAAVDPLRRLRGWAALGAAVGDWLNANRDAVLVSDDREILASLVYYVRPHPFDRAASWNPRGVIGNHFELVTSLDDKVGRRLLFVTRSETLPVPPERFATAGPASPPSVRVGEHRKQLFFLYELSGFKGYR